MHEREPTKKEKESLDIVVFFRFPARAQGSVCNVVTLTLPPPPQTANDFMVICNVAKILELVVPLMEHPSETFLVTIEEDLMKLIIKYGMTVGDEHWPTHKSFATPDGMLQFSLSVKEYICIMIGLSPPSGGATLCELPRSSG